MSSYPATRDGGASRSKKHSLAIVARISAPKPHVSGASCVTIHLPVLETDSQIVSLSHGRIETFHDIKMGTYQYKNHKYPEKKL